MKMFSRLALAVIALTSAATAGMDQRSPFVIAAAAADENELHSVMKAFVDAWNGRDAEGMMALFADGAELIDAGRRFRGKAEIRTFVEPEVRGYTVEVLSVEPARADGQRIFVQVRRGGTGGGFRASFDLTTRDGLIVLADLQYA